MDLITLALNQLDAHPANSNVMPPRLFDKLVEHLRTTDRYPPIIVRPQPVNGEHSPADTAPRYQILDGHHRVAALRRIGQSNARCVVWEVDDQQALVLLATLNRLQGHDDPRKRAALVAQLAAHDELKRLAAQLPETVGDLEHLLIVHQAPPTPRAPRPLEEMPMPVHFFLLPAQRRELDTALSQLGGTREEALMALARRGLETMEELTSGQRKGSGQ